jgi:soluble lytic murein transglycosylase-like protein
MVRLASYLCWLILLVGVPAQAGGIYRYVEKDGTIVYTNVRPGGTRAAKARRIEGEFRPPPEKTAPVRELSTKRQDARAELDAFIESAARRYRIPSHLVRAVMHAESAFDPTALSPKGASGLMQLMPGTAREMYVKDIFDVRENIEGGTRYLRVLANEFNGDMVKMVAAYNAGPEAVRKYQGNVPPYEETQAFVRKVIALYFKYKSQAQTAAAVQQPGVTTP